VQLDEMVKRQGRTSTAARIAHAPSQIGELRGRVGFFAGARRASVNSSLVAQAMEAALISI